MTFVRKEIAYPLVLVWAFAGIAVKQADTQLVANTAVFAAAFLVAVLLGQLYRGIQSNRKTSMA